jgi:hypothetical protein
LRSLIKTAFDGSVCLVHTFSAFGVENMPDSRPSCFGISEHCMPRDENGIIQPQENCRLCDHLRECLQEAIDACGGVEKLKAESGSHSTDKQEEPGGVVGAILRWSERKRAAQRDGTS